MPTKERILVEKCSSDYDDDASATTTSDQPGDGSIVGSAATTPCASNNNGTDHNVDDVLLASTTSMVGSSSSAKETAKGAMGSKKGGSNKVHINESQASSRDASCGDDDSSDDDDDDDIMGTLIYNSSDTAKLRMGVAGKVRVGSMPKTCHDDTTLHYYGQSSNSKIDDAVVAMNQTNDEEEATCTSIEAKETERKKQLTVIIPPVAMSFSGSKEDSFGSSKNNAVSGKNNRASKANNRAPSQKNESSKKNAVSKGRKKTEALVSPLLYSGKDYLLVPKKKTPTASSTVSTHHGGPITTSTMTAIAPYSTMGNNLFPGKLYQMLEYVETQGLSAAVTWLPNGCGFIVQDEQLFLSKVLPKYFKATKFRSFQRQLILYGFHRIITGPNDGAWWHESFVRGRKEDLTQLVPIRGKIANNKSLRFSEALLSKGKRKHGDTSPSSSSSTVSNNTSDNTYTSIDTLPWKGFTGNEAVEGKTTNEKKKHFRPYNRYNVYFIFESENIIQACKDDESDAYGDGETNDKESHPPPPSCPLNLPPLPPRFANVTATHEWWIPRQQRKRRPHRKSHGVVMFPHLAKKIGDSWKTIDKETLDWCTAVEQLLKEKQGALVGLAKTERAPKYILPDTKAKAKKHDGETKEVVPNVARKDAVSNGSEIIAGNNARTSHAQQILEKANPYSAIQSTKSPETNVVTQAKKQPQLVMPNMEGLINEIKAQSSIITNNISYLQQQYPSSTLENAESGRYHEQGHPDDSHRCPLQNESAILPRITEDAFSVSDEVLMAWVTNYHRTTMEPQSTGADSRVLDLLMKFPHIQQELAMREIQQSFLSRLSSLSETTTRPQLKQSYSATQVAPSPNPNPQVTNLEVPGSHSDDNDLRTERTADGWEQSFFKHTDWHLQGNVGWIGASSSSSSMPTGLANQNWNGGSSPMPGFQSASTVNSQPTPNEMDTIQTGIVEKDATALENRSPKKRKNHPVAEHDSASSTVSTHHGGPNCTYTKNKVGKMRKRKHGDASPSSTSSTVSNNYIDDTYTSMDTLPWKGFTWNEAVEKTTNEKKSTECLVANCADEACHSGLCARHGLRVQSFIRKGGPKCLVADCTEESEQYGLCTWHVLKGNHPQPAQEYITDVTNNDVICGRGGFVSNPGNRRFRQFIQEFKHQFLNETKQRKPFVAMRVLEAVKNSNPPGRFLVKYPGGYLECGDDRAHEKASQALREGAAKLRKQGCGVESVVEGKTTNEKKSTECLVANCADEACHGRLCARHGLGMW